MNNRKTLKSVSVDGLKPIVTLTPVVESCGEGYRIHHINSDSIAHDGRDTFVPLRHVSKQKQRIFKLEEENAKLRDAMYVNASKYALQHMDEDELRIWATQQSEYIEELKELCKDMWQDIPKTESCGWSMSINTCTGSDECIGECSYWYRMHKLGIEVE